MSSDKADSPDAGQLTHLAAQAVRAGEDDRASELLRRAIESDPGDARPHVALAGILASGGQMEEAIATMTRAVALDPTFNEARFQLGMMQFTCGKVVDAEMIWAPLDRLEATHPLRLFKAGMLHLAKDDFDACVRTMQAGIAVCRVPSVAKEMQRVIDKVNALPARRGDEVAQPHSNSRERHVLLDRYEEVESARSRLNATSEPKKN